MLPQDHQGLQVITNIGSAPSFGPALLEPFPGAGSHGDLANPAESWRLEKLDWWKRSKMVDVMGHWSQPFSSISSTNVSPGLFTWDEDVTSPICTH
jgi:hypothetical protein